jgi:hypothetical protein
MGQIITSQVGRRPGLRRFTVENMTFGMRRIKKDPEGLASGSGWV